MLKQAMGYFGGVASSVASEVSLEGSVSDALVGSIVDVGGQKVVVRKRIGEGGFAFVYEVEETTDINKKYALKRLLAIDSEKRNYIIKEISLMKALSDHPNIVKFNAAAEAKGVSQKGCDEFLVLMEFCSTNLSDIMSKRKCKPYNPGTVAQIFAQITSAVAKMHRSQPPIVHRDLKLENILVDALGKCLKLCDFGSATSEVYTPDEGWTMNQRTSLEEEMAKHTTPMYRAPEMLDTWNHYSIHTPSDIWALGCLLYFLCFGRHPFEDSAKLAILNGNFKIPENDITFDAFHDLIRQMLVVDPGFRPSINQVQEHLAEICSTYGFDVNGELDLELESLTVMSESVSSESLSNSASTATSDATNSAAGIMSSLRGGAGSFMGKIRDTSKAVIQSVQHSMANRDLDLHLVTERIAAMSFPAEGLESAMRNHLEDIANILETRHPNHYMVFNLTERNYSVQKFVTGLCSQPGWSTQKPTAFRIVLETIHLCLDFLRRDAKNVIVIHCLDGKANTAVLVVGLLMACGFVQSYKDGLKFFALKRCDALLEAHHRIILRYIEAAFSGPSSMIESREVSITSVVLEPVPMFSKAGDGARPFVELTKSDQLSQSPLKVAPSSEYASLAFFSAYDEEAILKVNCKIDGDVIISVYHARQGLGSLFASKMEKILICRIYFHTGFLGANSNSLRFKLKDLDGVSANLDKFVKDFKVVVNFRPEKEIKSLPLKCKNADLSLLFGTKDELINNKDMMGTLNVAGGGGGDDDKKSSPAVTPIFEDHPKAPPRTKTKEQNSSLLISDFGSSEPVKNHQKPVVPQPTTSSSSAAQQQSIATSSLEENILLDFGMTSSVSGAACTQSVKASKEDMMKDDLPILGDLISPSNTAVSSASSSNIDTLLDFASSTTTSTHETSADLMMASSTSSKMKTSSSAETFTNNNKGSTANADPFDFFGSSGGFGGSAMINQTANVTLQPQSTMTTSSKPSSSNTADDLVSRMLNDLDMSKGGDAKNSLGGGGTSQQQQQPMNMSRTRPNYNVNVSSFASKPNPSSAPKSNVQAPKMKVTTNTFGDLLGAGFTPSSSNNGNANKSIGEMKKAETMKTMTPEEAKVFAWKEGKSRNLRALLCSLHTVIWSGSRWNQCGMHQLVTVNDVGKMYKKAILAVHPDRQMGTPNEELSKLIQIELNDAWSEFNKDEKS